ncbi:MAG: DUF3037 domain-containing protein [Bacteroidota bacterium]
MSRWIDYDYAVLRVVPRVHVEAFVNVGVLLHARTARFLAVRLADPDRVRPRVAALCPETLDPEAIRRHVDAYAAIANGAGQVGRYTLSERFHWLTAPRSAVLQTSALRAGQSTDPAAEVERLFQMHVL